MKDEKREKIITSAIKEFAENSYDNASTNNIVDSAGISKGLLFHYFGSKKALFSATLSFVIEKIAKLTDNEIDWAERDLLERIRQSTIKRIQLAFKYPYLHAMLFNAMKNRAKTKESKPMVRMYEEQKVDIGGLFDKMFTYNVDETRFRNQSDINGAVQIIRWSMEKYAESVFERITQGWGIDDLNQITDELDNHIMTLKNAFYKG